MANERMRGNDVGATGRTVAANVARARKSQQLSLQEVEERLIHLGRRISFSGLSKIERGERRVDVDDLIALAIALDTSPLGLLLPRDAPGDVVEVTGMQASNVLVWQWAVGEDTPASSDTRAFVSRSVPAWVYTPQIDMNWFGDIDLKVGIGANEVKKIGSIGFAAKTRGDVDWDRGDYVEHPPTPER